MVLRITSPLAVCFALALSGCADAGDGAAGAFEPQQGDTLTVVTAAVPTTGFWEGTPAKPTGGFEFALAQKLQERLDLERIRVVTRPFSEIVTGELDGVDIAISLITPTEERDEVLDFSAPYMDVPPALITRKGDDVPDLQTARELKWVTQRSTTLEQIVRTRIDPEQTVLDVGSIDEKVAAVRSGAADAALFDFPLAVAIAGESGGDLQVTAKLARSEELAIALPEGSDNEEAVSSAVRALVADGTIDELATAWLGPEAAGSGEDVPVLRSSRE